MAWIFSLPASIGICLLWGICSYFYVKKNEQDESDAPFTFPLILAVAIAVVAGVLLVELPHPYNLATAIFVVGGGVNAISDWRYHYLWPEITTGTVVLLSLVMSFGEGGVGLIGFGVCGAIGFGIWAITGIIGKETGFGDVLLIGAMGLALGPILGIVAYVLGTFSGLFLAVYHAKKKGLSYNDMRTEPLPFGPCLMIGFVLVALFYPFFHGEATYLFGSLVFA